ncbi:MAG: primosomal protein N' [Gemmatimonadaceae bacterium]|nr:primosomal protein N' [Gemmatimonadaceae bacterium]MCW5826135.1 primosomal protein N' [Gemmatimonadaceae bacterium]
MSAAAPAAPRRLVEVALPLPLLQTFTYAVPERTRHPVVAGSRVVAPVRGKRVIGISVGESDGRALGDKPARDLLDVPDAEPALPADLLAVCRWMSEYYVAPLGLVCRAVLPAALGHASKPDAPGSQERLLVLAEQLPTLLARDAAFARAPKQRQLYELLEQLGGRAPVAHLVERLGSSPAVVSGLVKRGLARIERATRLRDPFAERDPGPVPRVTPTAAQQAAVASIVGGAPGGVTLLHGITGSGKTLVYLEVLRRVVLEQGRSAIVLVPEIALTPQAVDRFRAVFGEQVAVLHSGLSDGERLDAWRALQRGERRIAVGARSAVFAPLANLGAIIVDEEHEASYKQADTPRYHAREVAIVRARETGAHCVLGSATPSLESWVNARDGRYALCSLPERVGGGALPAVRVVDLRVEQRAATPEDRARRLVLSADLERGLHERLARGEQSILLLNRRGYASFVQCDEGHVAVCPNCSISLTYHRTPERLVCHYCLHEAPADAPCPDCRKPLKRQRGLGTQQVERLLLERLPTARIARMDVDTTSGKWAHTAILDRVARGEVDILLGTQMIAKGLDFPNVTLVGVIDADIGINLPDFRSSERSFQLLSQVAGRAGRGPKGGEVVIQTRMPSHHAVRCAITHDYHAFVAEELPARESPPYPPTLRLANIVVSGLDESAVAQFAADVTDWLIKADLKFKLGITVLGPAPCPLERIKNRWRWHAVLKSAQPAALTRLLRGLMTGLDVPAQHDLRLVADRDPVSLL